MERKRWNFSRPLRRKAQGCVQLLTKIGADGQYLGALNPGYAAWLNGKLLSVNDENTLALPYEDEVTVNLQHGKNFLRYGVFLKLQIFIGPAEDIAPGRLTQWPAFLFHVLTPIFSESGKL